MCKKGFTLLELLVVVLIIGILASIALPQYRKAVWRSRNVHLKAAVQAIRVAQDAYILATGKEAKNFDELDVDLPLEKPVLSPGGTDGICNIYVGGTDAVRRGTDFEVILHNNAGNIIGLWTSGPYQCSGFVFSYNGGKRWECWESQTHVSNGNFCKKLEKLTENWDNGYGIQIFPM